MSSLIVEVCEVQEVSPHPNADRLQICKIKGWQVITAVAQVKEGDKVVYVPPDSVLSQELAEKWGVAPYLKPLAKDQFGVRPTGGRVGVAKLRGIHSFGFISPVEDQSIAVGTDVAQVYGITKWEPPVECLDGDAAHEVPAFHKYTDIENVRNFPDVVKEGEEVYFSEKVHGKNCRVGLIRAPGENGEETFQFMAGSHGVRRKELNKDGKRSEFWDVLNDDVKALLQELSAGAHNVVLFGEIFGSGVQDMTYGMSNGKREFRAFDIAVDGKYLDLDVKVEVLAKNNIKMVPVLYRGLFSKEKMMEHTTGETTVCDPKQAGKFTGREGIVITPVKERWDFSTGRVILKSINPDYLMRKDGTEHH